MNKKQRLLTVIALVAFVVIGACHYLGIEQRMVGRSPHFWEPAATDDGLHAWESHLVWIDPKEWEQLQKDRHDDAMRLGFETKGGSWEPRPLVTLPSIIVVHAWCDLRRHVLLAGRPKGEAIDRAHGCVLTLRHF